MKFVDLRKLKRPRLIEIAGQFSIKRRHRLRKRDLIKKLEKFLPEIQEKISLSQMPPSTAESSTMLAPTQPSQEQAPYIDRGAPIPLHYGQDRITILVRDPNCIHAYWELQGPRLGEVMRERGNNVTHSARWVLRVHTEGQSKVQDITIVAGATEWYLSVDDNNSYLVEVGLVTESGEFISIARSNRATTPRSAPSMDDRCLWMIVDGDRSRMVTNQGAIPDEGFVEVMADRFEGRNLSSGSLGVSGRVPGSHHMGSESLQKKRRQND